MRKQVQRIALGAMILALERLDRHQEEQMHAPFRKSATLRLIATSATTFAILAISGSALGISQSGEKMNMNRLGHTDLQGRPSYQPNVIQYPDGRYIAFAGMHNGVPVPVPAC